MGATVEREDETQLYVKDREGRPVTFSRGRIIRVVPLVDPGAGGQDGVIYLRNGSTIQAKVFADDFDQVEYEVSGIRNRVDRSRVMQVLLEPPFEEKLQRFRESIKPGEVRKRLALAQWLVDQKRYDLAREELVPLTKEADLPEARDLLRQVEAQLALGGPAATGGAPEEDDGAAPGRERRQPDRGPVDTKDLLPSRLLSVDDVNVIRVYEVDLSKPPRLEVPPQVIRDMITSYGSSALIPAGNEARNQLFNWEAPRLLKLLFDLKARDLYPRVRVLSEPWALNLFRTRVHDAWVIPNCATSKCHGGIDAGRFFLHRRASKDERVRYTNLLILLRSKLDHPVVDFTDPESSLLIQYALPRDQARYPHPEVPGWKPVFTGTAKGLKADTLQWIRAMYQPRPDYPVDYEPPHLDAIDRPGRPGEAQPR